MTITDFTTATPREIDTELAAIYAKIERAEMARENQWLITVNRVERFLGLGYREEATAEQIRSTLAECVEVFEAGDATYITRPIAEAAIRYGHLSEVVDSLEAETQPHDEEFYNRGGWTRAFLVLNANGHVHSSRNCSTCFTTTRYAWLPEYSGGTEQAVVEDAGERACTVCYPSAPVDVLKRRTKIFSDDEKAAQKARVERAAAKAAKDAAKIEVPNYYGWHRTPRTEVFKSTRAVTNAIASNLKSLCWYGESHPDATTWLQDNEGMLQALADKDIEYDMDKALLAARKGCKRDGSDPLY